MTDSELRDQAVEHLKKTTISYPVWKKRVDEGYYKFPENTEWGKAFSALEQIGQVEVPPQPSTILPRYGISNGYAIFRRSLADRAFELDSCKEAGAKWIRLDTTTGNQAALGEICEMAFTRELVVVLILHGTVRTPFGPDIAYQFAKNQAAKWEGAPVVFEFCNEPDLGQWTPENYTFAMKGSYNGLKEVDPNSKLLAGALWKCENHGGMANWVTRMYDSGAKDHFDAFSVHLYDVPSWDNPLNSFHMAFGPGPNVRQVMDDHGDSDLPIICTEAGATITKVSEEKQAERISEQLADNRPQSMATFTMMDDAVAGFGLLRLDLTKRPSWFEYVKAVK